MSRNLFCLIRSHSHLADNTQRPPGDKIYKVRPAFELLNASFRAAMDPGEHLALDEATIPTRARDTMKQYNSAKPHKYGFKMFKLCASNYFVVWFMLFGGRKRPRN